MSNLTPELNLAQAVDSDDTADYLTLTAGLAGSLAILDGLFNNASGHTHSGAHQGGVLGANAFPDNTIPGAKLVDLSVYGAKIAAATITVDKLAANMLEALFANALTMQSANYTVPAASPVMFVWAQAAITVTLTAGTWRPIVVRANSGNTTVASTSGTVVGGSLDPNTGAVINGRVSQGDALTYKWDGTNWYAV